LLIRIVISELTGGRVFNSLKTLSYPFNELAWSGYNLIKINSTLNQELLMIKSLKIIALPLIQIQNYFNVFVYF
jgi:hypothetical protein